MGKYAPPLKGKFKGLIFVDPEELAKKVVDSYFEVVRAHGTEMRNNYEDRLRDFTADTRKIELAKQKLARFYRDLLPRVAPRLADLMADAKSAYIARKGQILAEVYR